MRKRAIFYTLEFDGELVHDVESGLKVILQKDHIKGKLSSWQPSCFDEPLVCQDVREIMPTWFTSLNSYFNKIQSAEDYLAKHGRLALEEKLAWLKKFLVIKWTMDPNQPRHLVWKDEAAFPGDSSPSFAKCIKNIEKVLS